MFPVWALPAPYAIVPPHSPMPRHALHSESLMLTSRVVFTDVPTKHVRQVYRFLWHETHGDQVVDALRLSVGSLTPKD